MGNNEKLNIKTSLREDGVIFKNLRASDYDNLGRYYNIKTVEQFINHDFHEDGLTSVTICKYEAVQNVLKYAYLGLPLKHGELLDKKYSDYELNYREGKELFREIRYDLITLGFTGNRTSDDIRSYIEKKYSEKQYDISLIGFIRYNCSFSQGYSHSKISIPRSLLKFYLNYYDENLKNKEESSLDVTYDNILDLLKRERYDLIKIRDSFNEKIDKLTEKIEYLENKENKSLKMTLKDE